MVGHVVGVVDLAVEQLEADGNAVGFGDGFEAVEAGNGVARAVFVGHATATSCKGDDVGDAGFGGDGDVFAEGGFDGVVVLEAIERVGDGSAAGVAHGADEAVAVGDFVLVDFEQVDAFEAERGGPLAELVDRDVFVAPATDGLMNGFAGCRLLRLRLCGQSGGKRGGGAGFEKCAARRHGNRVQGNRVQGTGYRGTGYG